MLPINLIAVIVAAVAAFIIGFLAHGSRGQIVDAFGECHMTGNEKMSDMYGQMFWNLS